MKLFFGGLPTEIDVRKLEALGDLPVGREISHEEIEALLELDRNAGRYHSVTGAWRKAKLRDGTEIGAVSGVGFRVLNEVERVDGGVKGVQQGMRKQLRSIKRAVIVRTDEPALIRKQDLLRRLGAAITKEATDVLREIAPPKAEPPAPRTPPTV